MATSALWTEEDLVNYIKGLGDSEDWTDKKCCKSHLDHLEKNGCKMFWIVSALESTGKYSRERVTDFVVDWALGKYRESKIVGEIKFSFHMVSEIMEMTGIAMNCVLESLGRLGFKPTTAAGNPIETVQAPTPSAPVVTARKGLGDNSMDGEI